MTTPSGATERQPFNRDIIEVKQEADGGYSYTYSCGHTAWSPVKPTSSNMACLQCVNEWVAKQSKQ